MSLFGSRLNFAANTVTFDSNTARVYGDVKFDDQLNSKQWYRIKYWRYGICNNCNSRKWTKSMLKVYITKAMMIVII